jgi:hypothetical protein
MYGKKMMDGGQVIGGPLKMMKAKRPNPYTGNEPEADDIERASEGQKFADGGMADKKKGAVMAIVAKLAKKPMGGGEEEEMEEGGEEGSEEHESMEKAAKTAAANEVMSALKSGDVEALAEALTNFHKSMAYGGMAGKEC